jgi:hypothetical protein
MSEEHKHPLVQAVLDKLPVNPKTGKKIIYVDASLAKKSQCRRRAFLTGVVGARDKTSNASMVSGSALHKHNETWLKKTVTENSQLIELAQTPGFMESYSVAASTNYLEKAKAGPRKIRQDKKKEYLLDPDYNRAACYELQRYMSENSEFTDFEIVTLSGGEPLVECKFAFRYHQIGDFEFWLAGTIDLVLRHKTSKVLIIGDWKSTSSHAIDDFLGNYKLSGQLRFYVLAIKHLAMMNPVSVLTQALTESSSGQVGAAAFGIFTSGKNSPVKIKRSEVFFYSDEELGNYQTNLLAFLDRLALDLENFTGNGKLPLKEGIFNGTCGNYFSCEYFALCASGAGEASLDLPSEILNQLFDMSKNYNPLMFGED